MQKRPYQEYIEWGQKRYDIVEQTKHQQPSQVDWIKISFPEQDFVELYGEQDKKAIKIKTYRHKVNSQFKSPKAVIIFLHNIGVTGQVSGHFAEDMSKKGYETVTMDLRGHGLSEGEKGYLDSYENIMKDVENFVTKVKNLYADVPLFALGDGIGCLLIINLLKNKKKLPFNGIIFAGPSFGQPKRSTVLSKLSEFSLKIMPNKAGIFALKYQNFSRNPNVGKLLTENKLMYHDKVCVGSLISLTAMAKDMNEKTFKSLQFPSDILIVQGQKDKSSDAFSTITFYESIKCKKELLYYKDMWHMFLAEKQYPKIRDQIQKWIEKRF